MPFQNRYPLGGAGAPEIVHLTNVTRGRRRGLKIYLVRVAGEGLTITDRRYARAAQALETDAGRCFDYEPDRPKRGGMAAAGRVPANAVAQEVAITADPVVGEIAHPAPIVEAEGGSRTTGGIDAAPHRLTSSLTMLRNGREGAAVIDVYAAPAGGAGTDAGEVEKGGSPAGVAGDNGDHGATAACREPTNAILVDRGIWAPTDARGDAIERDAADIASDDAGLPPLIEQALNIPLAAESSIIPVNDVNGWLRGCLLRKKGRGRDEHSDEHLGVLPGRAVFALTKRCGKQVASLSGGWDRQPMSRRPVSAVL